MELKQQCCTLVQAKRLKECGVNQKSLFNYVGKLETNQFEIQYTSCYDWSDYPGYATWPLKYSAWTVAELGVMLPSEFDTMRSIERGWSCFDYGGRDIFTGYGYEYEAECRSAAIIHLLENKLITAEEVNQRLLNA